MEVARAAKDQYDAVVNMIQLGFDNRPSFEDVEEIEAYKKDISEKAAEAVSFQYGAVYLNTDEEV